MKIPEQKIVELSKEKIHRIRTNVSGEIDSKGKFKPKITIEIEREVDDGGFEEIKKVVLEQLNYSKEMVEEKITEMFINMNSQK